MPLTVRPTSLSQHGGQISLPGGTVEPTESSHEAAARELFEELGVDDAVKLLGQLSDCYVFASDFVVTPWVAAAAGEPRWRIGEREVQRIVEMPLDLLLDDEACGRMTIQRGPLAFHAPCYCVGDDRVWGATSVILGELAAVLRGLAKTL